jgi:hypothetical protein
VDLSGGLTSGEGAARRASGGGARCARRSRRGDEYRGVRMSTVELAGNGGAFYRAGEAVGRRGGGRWRWSFNPRRF